MNPIPDGILLTEISGENIQRTEVCIRHGRFPRIHVLSIQQKEVVINKKTYSAICVSLCVLIVIVFAASPAFAGQVRQSAVGNTVDVVNATWTSTIGANELIAVWEAPDFDSGQSAFYYALAIEIPTPRWTAYDAKRYGVEIDPKIPMITQERAYTSPIWYTP
ncbi:MAG: DUF3604 domain-containing protein [bacterium]|nr:DUF3604 domain-containing protein [bacterium]